MHHLGVLLRNHKVEKIGSVKNLQLKAIEQAPESLLAGLGLASKLITPLNSNHQPYPPFMFACSSLPSGHID
jgi:hypothetical protein